MPLKCGDTFILPKKGSQTEHLWIVITDPDPRTTEAVCVNVTGRKADSETTVILTVGEHRFITKESVIFFQDARLISLSLVEKMLTLGSKGQFVCVPHDPCEGALLKRIQQGMLNSDSPSKDLQNFCRKKWGL